MSLSVSISLFQHLPFAQKLPAYAYLLVQHALVLEACSQEAEGQAGKASSADSAIRNADVIHARPAVAAPAPLVWNPVTPTTSAAQASAIREKLPAYAHLMVQCAIVFGTCRQEVEGWTRKASSPDSVIRRADVTYAQSNSCEVYRPSSPSSW